MTPPNLTSPPPPFTVDQFARFWAAPDTSLIVGEMFAPDVVGDWPGDPEPARGFARQYGSTNQAEERPHLVHELLRLLECGEMAAAVGLVPVPDVAEAPLGPPAGRSLELPGEDRAPGRHVDRVARLAGDPLVDLAHALPVQPGR